MFCSLPPLFFFISFSEIIPSLILMQSYLPSKSNSNLTSTPVFAMSPAALNVGQELESCVEPKLIEKNDNRSNSPFESRAISKTSGPPGGWNLSDCLAKSKSDDLEQVYLHPLSRRSMYSLSEKSLEMCTENLGSETGCVVYSGIDEFTSGKTDEQSFLQTKTSKTREFPNKMDGGICFPPPLSSISGRDGVRMQSHREGGRLVIKASSFSCGGTCFRPIREHGRLRLCLQMDEHCSGWGIEPAGNQEEEEDSCEPEKSCDPGDGGGNVGCGERCSRSRSRCNGSGGKRLAGLPCYVAIVS